MHFAFHGVNLAGRRVSSPRARGCSLEEGRRPAPGFVFPACAGVFLCAAQRAKKVASLPRVRGGVSGLCNAVVGVGMVFPACAGGVPFRSLICAALSESSPRVRGCSEAASSCPCRFAVFPACAGVFRSDRTSGGPPSVFPACAGVFPGPAARCAATWPSSPRVRGCSRRHRPALPPLCVFPACAGVFPHERALAGENLGLPRVRGGVPSPDRACHIWNSVFPACAGVFPVPTAPATSGTPSSPRVRGCSRNRLGT